MSCNHRLYRFSRNGRKILDDFIDGRALSKAAKNSADGDPRPFDDRLPATNLRLTFDESLIVECHAQRLVRKHIFDKHSTALEGSARFESRIVCTFAGSNTTRSVQQPSRSKLVKQRRSGQGCPVQSSLCLPGRLRYAPLMQRTEIERAVVDGSAFGVEKEQWKEAGHRFTPEELRAMEAHGADIVIFEPGETIYCAD